MISNNLMSLACMNLGESLLHNDSLNALYLNNNPISNKVAKELAEPLAKIEVRLGSSFSFFSRFCYKLFVWTSRLLQIFCEHRICYKLFVWKSRLLQTFCVKIAFATNFLWASHLLQTFCVKIAFATKLNSLLRAKKIMNQCSISKFSIWKPPKFPVKVLTCWFTLMKET